MYRFMLVLSLLAAAVPAVATVTSLVIIPTADIAGPGTLSLEYQFDNYRDGQDAHYINALIGIGSRFEAGLAIDLSHTPEDRFLGSFKYQFLSNDCLDTAVGALNHRPFLHTDLFLVTSVDLHRWRIHLGIQEHSEKYEKIFGSEFMVNETIVLVGDCITGLNGSKSIGLTYTTNDQWSVMGALIYPKGGNKTVSFVLAWTGDWR